MAADRAQLLISSGNTRQINAGTALSAGAAQTGATVFAAVYDGVNSRLYRNGVSLATGDAGALGMSPLTLGASFNTTAANFADAGYSELDFYSGAHTPTQVAAITAWLQVHWGF